MSGHRRVKDVAYDEDELDDYSEEEEEYGNDGEEELSPEDQEQMRQGTIRVREALGTAYSVSDKEIQDALWHYYYDVGKSVSYLKNLRPPAQAKKPKTESRFDKAASSAAQAHSKKTKGPRTSRGLLPIPSLPCERSFSAADFFKDTPWLDVPSHRLGEITIEPLYPRGGLLGGSSKPSKLAALAATRKKKAEEDKKTASGEKEPDRAISLLDRLGSKGKTKENKTPGHTGGAPVADVTNQQPRAYPIRRKRSPSPVPTPIAEVKQLPEWKEDAPKEVPNIRAPPSTFAMALVGSSRASADSKSPRQGPSIAGQYMDNALFSLPFTSDPELTKHNPFAGPSPDDIVLNAQAKGSKSNKQATRQANGDGTINGVVERVAAMGVEEAPKVKSKNLNVLEEYEKSTKKNAASFVVVGHVDHGKSTLMGRLLYDLKVIDQRSVDKLRKEAENIGKSSFALAWVMDQTSEERARGVTVDIATNYFETEKTRFTILDAPGHQDFIPNMIAGASQADFAVLVIDASTNSFESGLRGQTKEHALLVRSMGVQRLVIAVNKMDTVSWSQDRFQEIEQQMIAFLTSAGFQPKNLAFVPCAGLTGDNIVRPPSPGTAPWYTGRALVEELDVSSSQSSKRALTQPLRLSIADLFRGGVTTPLSVSGRLDAGSLQVGDQVVITPAGATATIKAIEVDARPADWAVAGQIATLHLADVDPASIRPGDIICAPSSPIKPVTRFTTKLLAFEHVLPMPVDVHRGRLHAAARVAELVATLDKASGAVVRKRPRVVQPGSVARVVVELEVGMPVEVGTRVVLRAEGGTVAAGLVEVVG